jgi:hypothetical protein
MSSEITDDSGAKLEPTRIFVCSSGDMIPERQATLRVIEALNRAAPGAARLEPYLWEENIHRFQGAQSYQGNIPLPAEFDIFLGFLFSRIGSRLTEEEYRRDIATKLTNLHASWAKDEPADLAALTQLATTLPPEALPPARRSRSSMPVTWRSGRAAKDGLASGSPSMARYPNWPCCAAIRTWSGARCLTGPGRGC